MGRARILGAFVLVLVSASPQACAQRQLESLGRGVVAIARAGDGVYVSWRLLCTDPDAIAFNLYRESGASPLKVNAEPISRTTDFADREADVTRPNVYFVRPVVDRREGERSAGFTLAPERAARPYLSIALKTTPGYAPNDASPGDLDGDGEYEIVVHQAGRGRDNAQRGATTPPLLEAYKLDGTFLWRIDLGRNIREGAHYTQFIVFDLDGDGRAEVGCKTADGTVDGTGVVIGDASKDHRNADGYILAGPEFLTIFEGRSGRALATAPYIPPRGDVAAWGDADGNRVDRFLACVAYLDGARPSLVMCRGYYTRAVLAAWNWRDGALAHVWTFDSDAGPPENRAYRGQGNHNIAVADVDGDGRDEILYGACVVDDNGAGRYTTGLGHGDAMHVSDLDPDRPGLEVFAIHERPRHPNGAELHDAATGALLWGKAAADVGRGLALDIDPRHKGCEMWAAGFRELWNCKGEVIGAARPRSCNMGIWWDGDALRELLDGVTISKWNYHAGAEVRLLSGAEHGCAANNGSKANPCLCADILGDWREELICRSADQKELRIFTTVIPAERRFYTFMHDPVYRLGIAWQNVAYNQPAHTGFYMGAGMSAPPQVRAASR